MSTENEEWRENSFNEENTGAGRDGNRSYNREGGERPYRPSYNREGGDRPYRPRFNANNEGCLLYTSLFGVGVDGFEPPTLCL